MVRLFSFTPQRGQVCGLGAKRFEEGVLEAHKKSE